MKTLNSPQKVLILFLSVFVILSSIFIVRLEIKAASLQSRLDEHHKSLEKNKDVLAMLEVFGRYVKMNGIKVDGNAVQIIAGQSLITLDNNNIDIETKGDITLNGNNLKVETNGELSLGEPSKTHIGFDKSGNIYLGVNSDKTLGYDKSKDIIYMYHNGSEIRLGQHKFKSTGTSQGISLRSKTGGWPSLSVTDRGIMLDVPHSKGDYRIQMGPHKDNLTIIKDESEIKLKGDNIDIKAKGDIRLGPTKDKYLGYNSKEDEIQIHQSGSTISFGQVFNGKTLIGNGVKIQGKNNGPRLFVTEKNIRLQIPSQKGSYDITLDPSKGFLGLRCGESYVILEKDNIDIEAKGNISINSLNGNVNINGKKVNLNE